MHLRPRLIVLALAQLSAVLIFLWGFLLAKVELSDRSVDTCFSDHSPAFDKAVWVVIDGLRFDFAAEGAINCSQRSALDLHILRDLFCELVRCSPRLLLLRLLPARFVIECPQG